MSVKKYHSEKQTVNQLCRTIWVSDVRIMMYVTPLSALPRGWSGSGAVDSPLLLIRRVLSEPLPDAVS